VLYAFVSVYGVYDSSEENTFHASPPPPSAKFLLIARVPISEQPLVVTWFTASTRVPSWIIDCDFCAQKMPAITIATEASDMVVIALSVTSPTLTWQSNAYALLEFCCTTPHPPACDAEYSAAQNPVVVAPGLLMDIE
jgi:hypothetical protein